MEPSTATKCNRNEVDADTIFQRHPTSFPQSSNLTRLENVNVTVPGQVETQNNTSSNTATLEAPNIINSRQLLHHASEETLTTTRQTLTSSPELAQTRPLNVNSSSSPSIRQYLPTANTNTSRQRQQTGESFDSPTPSILLNPNNPQTPPLTYAYSNPNISISNIRRSSPQYQHQQHHDDVENLSSDNISNSGIGIRERSRISLGPLQFHHPLPPLPSQPGDSNTNISISPSIQPHTTNQYSLRRHITSSPSNMQDQLTGSETSNSYGRRRVSIREGLEEPIHTIGGGANGGGDGSGTGGGGNGVGPPIDGNNNNRGTTSANETGTGGIQNTTGNANTNNTNQNPNTNSHLNPNSTSTPAPGSRQGTIHRAYSRTLTSMNRPDVDWIIPLDEKPIREKTMAERLEPTLQTARSERDKYAFKAKLTGYALNIAIGLQVVLGAMTTGLSVVTTGKQTQIMTAILGGLATIVASYLARARGSNQPELSITRVKDLEHFIRECEAFKMDSGHILTSEHVEYLGQLEELRGRFEELMGNGSGERKLATPV